MKKIILTIFAFSLFILSAGAAQAKDLSEITDWYIKNFESEIIVNTDASLTITEKITADCGNLPDKHGIIRMLPTFYQKTGFSKVKTPVILTSITDFNNKPIPYTSKESNGAITWKIGDPAKTVTGINNYKITYRVENAVRLYNSSFDEFYWNLNGNFWEISTEKFTASITFPEGINESNANLSLYSGSFEDKDLGLAKYEWKEGRVVVSSLVELLPKEGITLSVTFPKNIIAGVSQPFVDFLSILQLIGMVLIPVLVFYLCYKAWLKYGRDPKPNKPEMVQYSPPLDLPPMELGTLYNNGYFSNKFLSAAIIKLAVDKIIIITEIPKEGIFGKKDFKLNIKDKKKAENLRGSEKVLFENLFEGEEEILLSSLENNFYRAIPKISGEVNKYLVDKKLFGKEGASYQILFVVLALIFMVGGIFLVVAGQVVGPGLIVSAIILFVFAFLMRKRTEKGAEVFWQIKGFKLYMSLAEKYRQQFQEKEGLFEKFLPYAMVFGITSLWIANIKKIYGEEYFTQYHPYWYAGYAFASFNASSLEQSINSMTSAMTSTMSSSPSSSGSGGGGFSGGGGGGGGGGGW